jgi:uncharacterized membrane protein YkoI
MKVKKNIAAVMLTAGLLAALGFGGAALADGGADDDRPRVTASESPSAGPSRSSSSSTDGVDDSAGPSASSSSSASGGSALTAEQAKAIAVRAAGGGRVESIERETEHGRLVWDADVIVDGVEHDIDVDAATGEVTRHRTDDDRGRGRGGDDKVRSDDKSSDDKSSDDKSSDDKGGDRERDDDRGRGGDDD